MVTKQDVKDAVVKLGVKPGDSVLVHSSFKSLGPVENGADTVVSGLVEAVGEEGTVIFPTLCQKDWGHVYENWHLNADSDVGYLTNYFRKLPGAYRSDQATHSVAAMGKDAKYITETHGKSGLRFGIFGDTPFAADSPWEKMYKMDTKMIFLGVSIRKCTMRHYVEYVFMEDYLNKAKEKAASEEAYQALEDRLWHYSRRQKGGVWPHVDNVYVLELMEEMGKASRVQCGDAELIMVSAKDFVDLSYDLLEKREEKAYWIDEKLWDVQVTLDWLKEVDEL